MTAGNVQRLSLRIGVTALICLIVSGCAAAMSNKTLLKKMGEKPAPLIVDVRSQGEYDKDHIAGAVHIPFYAINSGLRASGIAKKDTVILYCEHGPRAGLASLLLFFTGYEHLFSVDGHMKAWRAGGLPVEKQSR